MKNKLIDKFGREISYLTVEMLSTHLIVSVKTFLVMKTFSALLGYLPNLVLAKFALQVVSPCYAEVLLKLQN